MKKSAGHDRFLLSFIPEQWDAIEIFSTFPYEAASNNKLFKRGRSAVNDHLVKYRTFAGLANKLIPGFEIDREQLKSEGYSPAIHSKEFAAIVESCVCELYSTLDGVRDIIFTIYNEVQGVQKKSTEKLYRKANNKEYEDSFPEELNIILSNAYSDWFKNLRSFRTEMVHGSLGHVAMDHETKKIRYVHFGMSSEGNPLIMEDFVQYISELYSKVLNHLNEVFDFLYRNLNLKSTSVLCGTYKLRLYERLIEPEYPLTNQSGYCVARQWFDNNTDYRCPLSAECKAYEHAISQL